MKIGIFTDTYSPDINGVVTSIRTIEDELVKHGHDVYIITSSGNKVIVHEGNIIMMPGFSFKKLYGYKISNLYSSVGAHYIKRLELDVIHTHTEYGIGLFARIVASKFKIPLVYTYHTMMEDYTHYVTDFTKGLFEEPVKNLFIRSSKLFANHCTELIVPSQKTYDAMLRYGVTNKINIIPTGVNLEAFASHLFNEEQLSNTREEFNIKDDDFLAVYLGRLAVEKSVDFIIDSFSLIKKDNIKLLLVGDGPAYESLKKQIDDLNLNNNVIMAGKVNREQVPLYYQIADVFISTSQTETQGLTFIEAMASHLPIIARYDENLKDVISEGETGFFIDTKDSLAQRLILLNEMPFDEYTNLCNNAKEQAMQYSSRIFYEKVINVYDKAIRNTRQKRKKNIKTD